MEAWSAAIWTHQVWPYGGKMWPHGARAGSGSSILFAKHEPAPVHPVCPYGRIRCVRIWRGAELPTGVCPGGAPWAVARGPLRRCAESRRRRSSAAVLARNKIRLPKCPGAGAGLFFGG